MKTMQIIILKVEAWSLLKQLQIKNLTLKRQVSLFHYWRIIDELEEFSATIEEGTINGIIGELGYGGWLLSSILSGRINDDCISNSVVLDGVSASIEGLKTISCYVGEGVAEAPYRKLRQYPGLIKRKLFGIKTVMEHIKDGLIKSNNKMRLTEIAEMFELTGIYENNERNGRINRPLEFQSGEVWRASMAIGLAYQKKLFCFPWLEPEFSKFIFSTENQKYIEKLRNKGATLIIPVSNEAYFMNKADQIIYLKRPRIML